MQVSLVKDINLSNEPSGSDPKNLISFNNKLYFSANNGVDGRELWVSDGTESGTQLVKDIALGNNANPGSLTVLGDKLFFSANANNDVEGNDIELFVTDGTESGTQLVKNIAVGGSAAVRNLIVFNNKLYFSANNRVNGEELWVSDGTESGTQLVKDIAGSVSGYNQSSQPENLTVAGNKLYFSADNRVNGRELWVSDGTAGGTQLVKDIASNSSGSYPSSLTEFNGKLYFSANNNVNGDELWVSNGTADGTQLLKDINPNGSSYATMELMAVNYG
jgi:ELWxxDGT repeat protein